jgi:hypothetical protein
VINAKKGVSQKVFGTPLPPFLKRPDGYNRQYAELQ